MGGKSTWEEASPKAEETGQVMHLLLASSLGSLPFLHVWTCSSPSFHSPASLIESPNPEHHLSTTSVVSVLPIPDLWAYLNLKYSLLLSLLLMYSLPQPSHWRSLFTLTWISKGCISFLGFMLVFPLKETLSLRWKQPLFFPLYLFLFQLSFHLCTVAIFSQ